MDQKVDIPVEYVIDTQDELIRDLQRRVLLLSALVRKLNADLAAKNAAEPEQASTDDTVQE